MSVKLIQNFIVSSRLLLLDSVNIKERVSLNK